MVLIRGLQSRTESCRGKKNKDFETKGLTPKDDEGQALCQCHDQEPRIAQNLLAGAGMKESLRSSVH